MSLARFVWPRLIWAFGLIWPLQLAAATLTGWIGTYTTDNAISTGSSGIYAFRWDTQSGVLSGIHAAATTTNPSFLVLHPSGRFLYAVNEDAAPSGTDRITAPTGSSCIASM